MPTRRMLWVALSLASVVLMAVSSAAGLYWPGAYFNETASWASQGIGQDLVNVVVVCPALLVAAYFVARGSVRGLLVWLGLLIYVIYSYVLYAFFVHFHRLFLAYVATLGLAFWAFLGATASLDLDSLGRILDRGRSYRGQVIYLTASGLLFATLWLRAIVPALVSGVTPDDVREVGLPVNPIHVLDLAFILPAMVVTAMLLRRRHAVGLVFAVPLMTFAAAMGGAIVGMSIVMQRRGLGTATGTVGVLVVLIAIALGLTFTFLRETRDGGAGTPTAELERFRAAGETRSG